MNIKASINLFKTLKITEIQIFQVKNIQISIVKALP